MSSTKMLKAAITATASYLPAGELSNDQLALEFEGLSAEKIFEKTGIRVRHIAAANECASDLGVAAVEKLFADNRCRPDEIDFLLLCTQSPDYFLPTTACLLQDRLGLRTDCGAVDINQGCSGFVYGLSLAKGLIESGTAVNVLLVTADTYSKFINARDRSVRTLFGDGAAATLISARDFDRDLIGPFVFGTDGSGARDLIVPAGGLRTRIDAEAETETEDEQGNWRAANELYMNGGAIYNFTLKTIPVVVDRLLETAGIELDQIDYFVPHQANKFMLDRLFARLRIPPDRYFCDLEFTANTVSSTIPIAIEQSRAAGRIKSGDRVALIGFGVGLSWAATIIEIP